MREAVQLDADAEDFASGDLGEEGPVLADACLGPHQLQALQGRQDELPLGLALQAPDIQQG